MALKASKLSSAICIALVGCVGLSASSVILAQEEKTTMSDRLVTGSRIARNGDVQGVSPVIVIERDDIAATGLTSLADVVSQLTISDGSALRNITTRSKTSDGSQHISLRGLGSMRTLVLVNGRRWVTSGMFNSGTSTFTNDLNKTSNAEVDLNTIPISIVERIEILKDGASAIYGSDAIGGVVNIITRQNYNMAEANAYFGRYSDGDGEQQAFDATLGFSNERANGLISLSYADQDSILAGNYAISSLPEFGGGNLASGGLFGSPASVYGNLTRCAAALVPTASGFQTCTPVAGGPFTLRPGEDGRQATDFRRFVSYTLDGSGSSDRYNFAPVNYLLQPVERKTLHAQGSLKLNENINANLMATKVERNSAQQVEETALLMDVRGVNGARWAFAPTAGNVFNPFGQDLRSNSFTTKAVGPVRSEYKNDNTALSLWLDGKFDLGGREMRWDAGYSYMDSSIDLDSTNHINLNNLRSAVGNSRRNPVTGALECLDSGLAVIVGCVPVNVFGGPDLGLSAGVITRAEYDAMLNYIRAPLSESEQSTGKTFSANLNGSITDLPAGPLSFALGFERRRSTITRTVDVLAGGGGSSADLKEATKGEQSVNDFYVEFNIPLLADRAFAKQLNLSIAARNSDYDANGLRGGVNTSPDLDGDTSTKYGFLWHVNDELMFRGSYSKSFRAPDVLDMFAGGVESLAGASDPCNTFNFANPNTNAALCLANGVPVGGAAQANFQLRTLTGGNANLDSELARTSSLGVAYSPAWAEGLSVGLDWYKIRMEDVQVFKETQAILNGCYLNPGVAGAAANVAQRDQFCAAVARNAAGSVATVRPSNFNVNKGFVQGYDLQLVYTLPSTDYGIFSFQWDTSYAKDNTLFGTVGTYNGSPHWETRSNLTTRWQKDNWDATWAMRYYSDMEEACGGANYFEYGITPTEVCSRAEVVGGVTSFVNDIPSRLYHDIQLGWKTPWNGRIALGARNVFGTKPPVARASFAHSFDAAYDLPGGAFYYLQYSHKF